MSAIRIAVRLSSGDTQPAWIERAIAALRSIEGVRVERCGERDAPVADVLLDLTELPMGPAPGSDRESGTFELGSFQVGAFEPGAFEPRVFEHWAFLYGDDARRDAPARREHLAGARCVLVQLVRLETHGGATILEEGSVRAVPHSLAQTRERLGAAVAGWPARQIRRRLAGGPAMTPRPVVPATARVIAAEATTQATAQSASQAAAQSATARAASRAATARRRAATPIGRAAARALEGAAAVRNVAIWGARQARRERWTIGVVERPLHHVLTAFDPAAIRWLELPPGEELADPELATGADGRRTLLAESLSARRPQGRIVALDWPPAGRPCAPRPVLDVPCHASHPAVLRHGRQVYCLPETSALGRVQLWRADPYPDRWVADRILLAGFAGTDATVFEHEGRWWMLAGNRADEDQSKLYAFHAPHLFGPWEAHPGNPVKCDLRGARPAGPLFRHRGELYRPAQDCSATYGGAIVVHRILELSPQDFREEPVTRLAPDPHGPYPHGLHTLAGDDEITLVDGKRHVLDPRAILRTAADGWRSITRRRMSDAAESLPRAARNEA